MYSERGSSRNYAIPVARRAMTELLLISEAIAAVDRAVFTGLERNLAGLSAFSADCVEHLAGLAVTSCALTCSTACLATLRLIGKALFSVKFLLSGSEGEFLSAILADERLVSVHL